MVHSPQYLISSGTAMLVNKFGALSVALLTFLISFVGCSVLYTVPDPKIEVFKRGFRVSIPDDEGLELFAFHGNINVPMHGIEAGRFSQDIVRKCGGYWVFEEKNSRLNVGDTIYYWTFVIKDRLGYRYDDGHFIVTEILELDPLLCHQPPKRKKPEDVWTYEQETTLRPFSGSTPKNPEDSTLALKPIEKPVEVSVCCDLFLNVSYAIISLAEENKQLQRENSILYELIERDDIQGKTLKVFGKYPVKYYPTPKTFVHFLVKEKLLLEGLRITEAEGIPGGVSFKVEKASDKIKIILATKNGLLEGSNYQITWQ